MCWADSLCQLVKLLERLGVDALDPQGDSTAVGFPLALRLKEGGRLVLDLPEPALISDLEPANVGVALVDGLGFVRRAWGLAGTFFDRFGERSLLISEFGPLVESALGGQSGSLYTEGVRFLVSPIAYGNTQEALLLATCAREERVFRGRASRSSLEADLLKELGAVTSAHTEIHGLCAAAIHALASRLDPAAAMLWIPEEGANPLRLAAHTGINRKGAHSLKQIQSSKGAACLAELVADCRKPLFLDSVGDNPLSASLEAEICYLKPGGVSLMPLMAGDSLMGVLEIVAKHDQANFRDFQEFHSVLSEHLALALNKAYLFERFKSLASNDPLTGIANHRTLQEFLHLRIAEAERTEQPIGALMIDVDHFRSFNEEEGHDVGDGVLQEVALALKQCVRQYDLAARYGGEEFTAILPGSDQEESLGTAERIRSKIESLRLKTPSGRERPLTVSIGVAVYPSHAQGASSLLRAADTALFEAKRSGRNRVVLYSGGPVGDGTRFAIALEDLWEWVPAGRKSKTEALCAELDLAIEKTAQNLKLTSAQIHLLRCLGVVAGEYRRARSAQSLSKLKRMEASPDLRILLPSLNALGERFDGKGATGTAGSRIPFLARLYDVFEQWVLHGEQALARDPGRFDPEVLDAIAGFESAA